jgi:hypothetical protein
MRLRAKATASAGVPSLSPSVGSDRGFFVPRTDAYQRSDMEIHDLIELVHSYRGRFDAVAARRAREWLVGPCGDTNNPHQGALGQAAGHE